MGLFRTLMTRFPGRSAERSENGKGTDKRRGVWVIRRGRSWPEPEQYASIILPDEHTGATETFVMAFVHEKHARSAARGLALRSVVEIFVDHTALDYLRKATLMSLGVAIFDDDVTYSQPRETVPRVKTVDDDLPVQQISDALEECLNMY